MNQAAADALDEHLVWHLELEDGVDLADALLDEHFVKCLRLARGSREAVQDEALRAVGSLDVVLNDSHHDVV